MTGDRSAKWPEVVGPNDRRSFGQMAGYLPAVRQGPTRTDRLPGPHLHRHTSVTHLWPHGGHPHRMPATLYKARGLPTKQPVCAICVDRTRGKTVRLDLGRGVTVWLCADHGSEQFRTSRSGRDFVLTLDRLWTAHGCMTKQRSRALNDHLAANRSSPPPERQRPGSYAWPALRLEAEALFRRGVHPDRVIRQLRLRHANDYAKPPSIRTMRRWYTDRRWMTSPGPLTQSPPSSDGQAGSSAAVGSRPIGQRNAGQLANPTNPTAPTQRPTVHVKPMAPGGACRETRPDRPP